MNTEIKENLVFLTKNIANLPEILLYLIQNDIISENESEEIKAERTSLEKNQKLLSVIEKKDWSCNRRIFLEVLKRTNNEHCADVIEGIPKQRRKTVLHSKILKNKWWPDKQLLIKPLHLGKVAGKLLVEELHDRISKDENRTVIITESEETWNYFGTGGVGKTLTAKWYAHHYEGEYEYILWIDSRERSLLQSFQKLARDLEIKNRNELLDAQDYARKSYEELEKWRCLLIYDNAENCKGEEGLLKILPKYQENFSCLITTRRKEWGIRNVGYLKISAFELNIFGDGQESLELMKFINEKLGTKTTKFNYAVSLHQNGQLEECVQTLEELFAMTQKTLTEKSYLTKTVEDIFEYLRKYELQINVVEKIRFFLKLDAEPAEIEVGEFLFYSYLRLGKNDKALEIGKQIVFDIGQVIQILSATQISNYRLKVNGSIDKASLEFDGETKKIELFGCSMSLSSLDRLSSEELTLSEVSFTRNGQECKRVIINDFVDLTKINRLTLECSKKKNVSIGLSDDHCAEYLDLTNVTVLDWREAKWNVHQLELYGIAFDEKTKMNIKEMIFSCGSHLDISYLPQTIQKLTLDETEVVCDNQEGINLPNLKNLTLRFMANSSCSSHFNSVKFIKFDRINEVNVDQLPESVTQIKIIKHPKDTKIIGGVKKLDRVILEEFSFKEFEKFLSHFQTDHLVVYYHRIKSEDLMKLMLRDLREEEGGIKTIVVGRVNGKVDYYLWEGGVRRDIGRKEFYRHLEW